MAHVFPPLVILRSRQVPTPRDLETLPVRQLSFLHILAILIFPFLCLSLSGCKKQTPSTREGASSEQAPPGSLELVFPYGSEKEKWINDVTREFNRSNAKTKSGKTIFVRALPMGSGETIDNILSGRLQAHLASPASGAFIKLGNAESRSKTGKDLIASTDNLVLSPVVIAMWKPMAEAIGWGKKPLGWADILALSRNEKEWEAYGYPQWGKFKFGHTHPEYSNSGLISLFAEAYAASGKTAGLTLADLNNFGANARLLTDLRTKRCAKSDWNSNQIIRSPEIYERDA